MKIKNVYIQHICHTGDDDDWPGCSSTAASRPCCLPLLFSFPPPTSPPRRLFFSSLALEPRLHFLILHFFLWTVSGQGSPPNWGSSFTMRVLMVCPLPQDLLHSDHSVHSDTMQSVAGERYEMVWGGGGIERFCEKLLANVSRKLFLVSIILSIIHFHIWLHHSWNNTIVYFCGTFVITLQGTIVYSLQNICFLLCKEPG